MSDAGILAERGRLSGRRAGLAARLGAGWLWLRSSDGYRARLARGTIWTTLGMVGSQLPAMVASILAARILGAAAFGQFGMLRSTIVLLGVVGGTGLGLSATKVVAAWRTADAARAGRSLTLLLQAALVGGGLVIATVLLGAELLAGPVLHAPGLAFGLRLASVLVLVNVVSGVQLGGLNGLEAFRSSALLVTAEAALTMLGVVGGAWLSGLNGAVIGMVLAPAALLPVKHWVLLSACRRQGVALPSRPSARELTLLWSDVLPAVLMGVSSQPFEWLARVLLARSGGYVEVGVFTAAFAWGQMVSLAAAQLAAPSLPIMANVFGAGERGSFQRLLRFVMLTTMSVCCGILLLVLPFAGLIMRVYGHGFAGGATVLRLLMIAYAISAISSLLRSALVATGRLWHQNMHTLIWGATMVATFFLLRGHGSLGLALAYLVGYCVIVATQGTSVWFAVRSRFPQPVAVGA